MPSPGPTTDDEIAVAGGDPESLHPRRGLGGLTRRQAPLSGLRPTVRFAIAFALTLAWAAFSVWASEPWRGELENAIGPVAGWVIPIFLAYVPALVIGFMIFTLLITRYEELPLEPPKGDWPEGWPPATILIAAWNESEAIVRTLERISELTYDGQLEVVVADNNSTDDTGLSADAAAERLGLRYRRVFEAKQGKHNALNAALATVTTPSWSRSMPTLICKSSRSCDLWFGSRPHRRASTSRRAQRRSSPRIRLRRSSPGCSSGTTGSGSTA